MTLGFPGFYPLSPETRESLWPMPDPVFKCLQIRDDHRQRLLDHRITTLSAFTLKLDCILSRKPWQGGRQAGRHYWPNLMMKPRFKESK